MCSSRRRAPTLATARSSGASATLGPAGTDEWGGHHVAHVVGDIDTDAVIGGVDRLYSERLSGQGIAIVIGNDVLAIKVGGDAIAAGIRAGDLVSVAAQATGGRGGGRPDFARGAVKDPALRNAALEAIHDALSAAVKS